jgi:hypothetical protein
LNSNKPILGSSSASKNLGARGSQRVFNQDDDDEESEEESDEDSSSSSAEEEDSKPKKTTASKPRKKPESSSTSDDDDSSSESESDSGEDEEKKLRDQLAAQIAGLGSRDSQGSNYSQLLSPKANRSSSQQSRSAEKKGKKYISGYSFSQPV